MVTTNLDNKDIKKKNVHHLFPRLDELSLSRKYSSTGKSLSEVLIKSSINPQYDNRLFTDLRVQYKKITRAEHVKNMLFTQIV